MWILMRETEKQRHKQTKSTETELSDCLPWCLDWRLLLFMTPKLQDTDQIRDTVRQMSTLALCSRHECCWQTHQRREGETSTRERTGRAQRRRWMERKRRKIKTREEMGKKGERTDGWGELAVGNQTSHCTLTYIRGTRSTLSCFCQTATSLVRKWHYKFKHTLRCDSHSDWAGGGTEDITCTKSPSVLFFKIGRLLIE